MKPTGFKTATCLLLVALLFVVGGTMSGAVSHDLHHAAHHSAGMHGKGVCAWMCATGAMAGQVSVHLAYTIAVSDTTAISSGECPPAPFVATFSSRAPPPLVG